MGSSQPSPLAGLLGSSSPRRSRSGSHKLGWALGIIAGIVVTLGLIGFGVDQQAEHHIINPASSSIQHS
jgi:hypothetical protein